MFAKILSFFVWGKSHAQDSWSLLNTCRAHCNFGQNLPLEFPCFLNLQSSFQKERRTSQGRQSEESPQRSGSVTSKTSQWDESEKSIYEMQLRTLQEQLVDTMIQNQTLRKKDSLVCHLRVHLHDEVSWNSLWHKKSSSGFCRPMGLFEAGSYLVWSESWHDP